MSVAQSRTTGRRVQEAKTAKARSLIINATIKSLAKNGYAETSLAAVARDAGYTKGALQHHFVNKEDLVSETLDELLYRSIKPYSGKIEDGETSVVEGLMTAWTKMVNTSAYRALLEILNASRTNKTLKKRINGNLRQWGKRMDEQAIATYESVSGDPDEVVMLMNMNRCFMRGLLLQELYGIKQETSLQYLERWVGMIAPLLKLKQNG